MGGSHSTIQHLLISIFLFSYCLAAFTTSGSTSEQLFWTQALPEPISDLTATVTLASRTTTSHSITSHTATTTPNASICNVTSIACPDCNDVHITDSSNKTYHILCDNKVYSDSPYPVQRWLSPSGCIAECDKYPWCKGATSWEEGNCQLARGRNVFPQYDEDHIALLQIPDGFVAPPPATIPSAFPTGNLPAPFIMLCPNPRNSQARVQPEGYPMPLLPGPNDHRRLQRNIQYPLQFPAHLRRIRQHSGQAVEVLVSRAVRSGADVSRGAVQSWEVRLVSGGVWRGCRRIRRREIISCLFRNNRGWSQMTSSTASSLPC